MGVVSVTPAGTGRNITTSGTSAGGALPADSSGATARVVRVSASAACYVRFGVGTQTAVAGDMLVQPGDSVVVKVAGCSHAAAIQVSSGGVCNIYPLEAAE